MCVFVANCTYQWPDTSDINFCWILALAFTEVKNNTEKKKTLGRIAPFIQDCSGDSSNKKVDFKW